MIPRLLSAEKTDPTYADFVAELSIRKWVARRVEDAGIEPIMARAIAQRLRWNEQLHSKEHFKGVVPKSKDAIDAIALKMKTL